MKKITIGIPTSSAYLHRKFVQSFMSLQYPPNVEVDINIIEGFQLPFARNRVVQTALKNGSTHIFWIDADMIFPADSLIRLFNRNVDICHALSFRRTRPHYPCIFKWMDENFCYETIDYSDKEELFEVDAAGSACTLVNIDVYKKLKEVFPDKPFFYYRDNLFSSDLTISENMKKVGYKIWVDRSLKTGHIGEEIVVDESFYLAGLSEVSKNEWNTQMKVALKNKNLYAA